MGKMCLTRDSQRTFRSLSYQMLALRWKNTRASCKFWMSGNFGAWQLKRRSGGLIWPNIWMDSKKSDQTFESRRRWLRIHRKIWPELWMGDKFPAFYHLVKSRGAKGTILNRYKWHNSQTPLLPCGGENVPFWQEICETILQKEILHKTKSTEFQFHINSMMNWSFMLSDPKCTNHLCL